MTPLDTVGWLRDQPLAFCEWVSKAARWRTFQSGQFVYQAGDTSDGIYGLGEGSLLLTFPLVAQEPVVFYRAEVGFWIGDNAELTNRPRLISLIADTNCRLLHLPSSAIRTHLENNPEDWRCFYALSAQNAARAVTQLAEALSLTVRARLCRHFLAFCNNGHDIEITQDELAQLLGVARATMRRSLADLVQQGAIQLHYRKVRILDAEILRSFRDEQ